MVLSLVCGRSKVLTILCYGSRGRIRLAKLSKGSKSRYILSRNQNTSNFLQDIRIQFSRGNQNASALNVVYYIRQVWMTSGNRGDKKEGGEEANDT